MFTLTAIAAAAAAMVAPAFASDVTVEFDRSLLTTAAGQAKVVEMIEDKALEFCRDDARGTRRFAHIASCASELSAEMKQSLEEQMAGAPNFGIFASNDQ
ncbi:UrcA family protein [Parvularcula maris]|uniref:UrcA family protein n=1 Tax=Parvularcula maris TaxID=2965077 RepID=A0A9X2L8G7_9PROT|nr:UrcA family protein [Parvularcula maris]MCQ8184962.1 UrcA family protein [Parvularcula maris]